MSEEKSQDEGGITKPSASQNDRVEGDADEGAARARSRGRIAIYVTLVVLISSVLVATDDGGLAVMARCFATGEGRAWIAEEPRDFEADFFGYTYVGNTDNLIDMQVLAFGAYEKPILFAMRDVMLLKAPKGQAVAVDVGANVGHHSIFLSKHAKSVHAIEPFPPVLTRMRGMLKRNAIDNVIVHAVGFSNKPGTLPFHQPERDNLGTGSFADMHKFKSKTLQLPLVRGDDELKDVPAVHLVKADVEGFERYVFQGMSSILERDRPVIVFELNIEAEGGFREESQLRAILPKNYEVFEIEQLPDLRWSLPGGALMCGRSRGIYHLVPYPMDFERSSINLMAVPKELVDKLPHRRAASQ